MLVRLLNEGQKTALENVKFTEDMYFFPIQDNAGNWIISEEEITQCDVPQLSWVKTLPQIEYVKIPHEDIII